MRPLTLPLMLVLVAGTLSLAGPGVQAGTEKVIYSFKGGHDGSTPYDAVISDRSGNFYGTTTQGGNSQCFSSGCGTVFELMPQAHGGWKKKTVYVFTGGADGGAPHSTLLFDATGNLYGLAEGGGTINSTCPYGCGVVFELSPNSNRSWKETVLYSFQGGSDGVGPSGKLVLDGAGNLYGTTAHGGGPNSLCGGGSCGTVFELSPKSGGWTETVLYRFQGGPDGSTPASGVIFDSLGTLYGTTLYGGGIENGTVFELKHTAGHWTENLLYSFLGGGNAGNPYGGVVFDASGNIYGTLTGGGNGGGAVFELKKVGNRWKEVTLYFFCTLNNCADGAEPWGTLLAGKSDTFYGTTSLGGSATCPVGMAQCGTVFELKRRQNSWQEKVIHQFGNSGDGFWPYSSLIFDKSGAVAGTTINGGTSDKGTVFRVHP